MIQLLMTEPIIGILTNRGHRHHYSLNRCKPQDESAGIFHLWCLLFLYCSSHSLKCSVFYGKWGSVSDSLLTKKILIFFNFLLKEFRNWKYFPKLFVCIKLRSQCVPLHSHLPLSAAQPAARPRLQIMLHSRNYFRFPRRRKTENGSGSELYQSCQAPSHHNSGPRIRLQPRLLWILVSGISD